MSRTPCWKMFASAGGHDYTRQEVMLCQYFADKRICIILSSTLLPLVEISHFNSLQASIFYKNIVCPIPTGRLIHQTVAAQEDRFHVQVARTRSQPCNPLSNTSLHPSVFSHTLISRGTNNLFFSQQSSPREHSSCAHRVL